MSTVENPKPAATLPKLGRAPRVTIEVTDEVIEKAVRANSHSCMIADAIKAQIPGASNIIVDIQTIRWSDPKRGVRYTYLTPSNAQGALIMFDRGIECEAFPVKLKDAHVTRMQRPLVPRVNRPGREAEPKTATRKADPTAITAAQAPRMPQGSTSQVVASGGNVVASGGRPAPIGALVGTPTGTMPSSTGTTVTSSIGTKPNTGKGGDTRRGDVVLPTRVRRFGARILKSPNPKAVGKSGAWVDPEATV